MRDFKLKTDDVPPELTLEEETTIVNNIFLSLAIRKGAWWAAPDFGFDFPDRTKLTDRTVALAEERIRQALEWIVDVGRARSIDVHAERDARDPNRLNVHVEAMQQSGRVVSYETFVEVA